MGGRPTRPKFSALLSHFANDKDNAQTYHDLLRACASFTIPNRGECFFLIVGLKGGGKSSLINSVLRALDPENPIKSQEDFTSKVDSGSLAHINEDEKDGTMEFQGYLLPNLKNLNTKLFDTKGIRQDKSFVEVEPTFLAMVDGQVKEGVKLVVEENYSKPGSISRFELFRPRGSEMVSSTCINNQKLEPMNCIIFVIDPLVDFPRSSCDRQIQYCVQKDIPFFFVVTKMDSANEEIRRNVSGFVKSLLVKHVDDTLSAEDFVIYTENFTYFKDSDEKKAKQALYILLFALVNAEWHLERKCTSKYYLQAPPIDVEVTD